MKNMKHSQDSWGEEEDGGGFQARDFFINIVKDREVYKVALIWGKIIILWQGGLQERSLNQ